MQIPALFSAVPAVLNSGLRLIGVDISAGIGESSPEPADARGVDQKQTEAVDLSSITPDAFSELIDRLRASGELPADGYRELLGVRLELDRARAPRDEPVDVVALLQAKLASQQQLESSGSDASDLTKRQLQWLDSLGTAKGINALA